MKNLLKKFYEQLGFEEFKWWYLITTPLIVIVGGVLFLLCYTVLIYILMCT